MPDNKTVTFGALRLAFEKEHDMLALEWNPLGFYEDHLTQAYWEGAVWSAEHAPAAQSAGQEAVFWRDLLSAVTREINDREYGHPWTGTENAPGHAHDIPGIWDSDNGDKAGTKCAWCMTWNKAREALNAAPVNGGEPVFLAPSRKVSREELAEMYSECECPGCEGKPAPQNNPCAVCGKRAADAQQVGGDEHANRYRVEKASGGFWPNAVRCGTGTRELFVGHKKQCERVAAELKTAFEDGRFVERTAALTSPAKVGGDEREAFEAWMKSKGWGHYCSQPNEQATDWGFDPTTGTYPHSFASEKWEVWQARAALSADGGEKHREADVGPLLCEAATTLPEGWEIVVEVENGYGGVNLIAPDETETDFSGQDMLLSEQIRAAIDAAIAANQSGKGGE